MRRSARHCACGRPAMSRFAGHWCFRKDHPLCSQCFRREVEKYWRKHVVDKFGNHFLYPKRWSEQEEKFYRFVLKKPHLWSGPGLRVLRSLGDLALREFTRSMMAAYKDGTLT